jgi:hypothetical protein
LLPLECLLSAPERLCAGDWQRLSIGVTATTSTSTLTLRLIRAANIELGEINDPIIAPHILGDPIRVRLDLVSLQVHLRLKYNELLVQAFLVKTNEMIFLEVNLQSIVVDVVLLLTVGGPTVADMASLVLVSTVSVELVVAVESLPTESTLGVALEAALIDRTRFMIAMLLVFP